MKGEDKKEEIEGAQHLEDEVEPKDPSSPKVATFEGRLQLRDFMFKSTEAPQPPLRRSPRNASATATTATPAPSGSSASTPKRKVPPGPSSTNQSKQKQKKQRTKAGSGYAPPSTYAHLPLLPDAIAANLLVLFIGLNPGIQTARSGHAYAHPSNLFWKLLYSSGVTPRLCRPDEDRQMPELYSTGHTNIVARPSRNGAELSKHEMDEGVDLLEDKVRTWRPETACVVGKSIWESIWRVRHGRPVGKDFRYGWQDDSENMGVIEGTWPGARVFVASSTSGLAATLSPAEKQKIWDELGAWVKMRRAERENDKDEKEKEAEKEEENSEEKEKEGEEEEVREKAQEKVEELAKD